MNSMPPSNGQSKVVNSSIQHQQSQHHQSQQLVNKRNAVAFRNDRYPKFSSGEVSFNGESGHTGAVHNVGEISDEGQKRSKKIMQQPTPLFERLVTEEVQELKSYARIIENQQRRLAEIEKVHEELEHRLEHESRTRQQVETTLEAREREWINRLADLEIDRNQWKDAVTVEQKRNARLTGEIIRKNKDIQQMHARKYDREGDMTLTSRSVRQVRGVAGDRGERTVTSASKSPEARPDLQKSPHEILAASGSVEKVRMRNVNSLLLDFFGT